MRNPETQLTALVRLKYCWTHQLQTKPQSYTRWKYMIAFQFYSWIVSHRKFRWDTNIDGFFHDWILCTIYRFETIDGGLLMELKNVQATSPEYFHQMLRTDFKLNVYDGLKLSRAIRQLQWQCCTTRKVMHVFISVILPHSLL